MHQVEKDFKPLLVLSIDNLMLLIPVLIPKIRSTRLNLHSNVSIRTRIFEFLVRSFDNIFYLTNIPSHDSGSLLLIST